MINTKRAAAAAAMIALLMNAAAASARPSHGTTQDGAAIPSSATLDAVTASAWKRFKAVYKDSGMSGLVGAVQDCYANSNAQKLQTLKCLQIDYFAHGTDFGVTNELAGSLNPEAELRTPYFQDKVFQARREIYTAQLAKGQADDLSAALLIHGQNMVRADTSGSGQ